MCCTGIKLSVKPSLVDSAEVQRVSLLVDGDNMTAGAVEVISTLKIKQVVILVYPLTQCVEGLVVLQCAYGAGFAELFVVYDVVHCVPVVHSMLSGSS